MLELCPPVSQLHSITAFNFPSDMQEIVTGAEFGVRKQLECPAAKSAGQALLSSVSVSVEGSYSGVVGLPLCETRILLNNSGIELRHG